MLEKLKRLHKLNEIASATASIEVMNNESIKLTWDRGNSTEYAIIYPMYKMMRCSRNHQRMEETRYSLDHLIEEIKYMDDHPYVIDD